MTKTFIALASTLILAVAAFSNTAEAGGRGMKMHFGGPLHSFKAFNHKQNNYQAKKRRAAKQRQIAKQRKLAKQRQIAKQRRILAQKKIAARKVAQERAIAAARKVEIGDTETTTNNPNATANISALAGLDNAAYRTIDGETAPAKETVKVAAVETGSVEPAIADEELTCKKYVPAAGMTITVPCAN